MPTFLDRARFATLVAVGSALLLAGVVAGAAGDPFIIGSTANNAGSSETRLTVNRNGDAFRIIQTGTGVSANGIRGDAADGTGGVFTSSNNNALFATVSSSSRYGVVARNSSASSGSGAALLADGNMQNGVIAESDDQAAVVATVNTCSGFLCGASGVVGNGFGFLNAGVFGEGGFGVFGIGAIGLYGDSNTDGDAVIAAGNALVDGDLVVNGTCTGCTASFQAVNGGVQTLEQGEAVTLLGVRTIDGRTFMVVGKANAGDVVLGLADRALVRQTETIGNPTAKDRRAAASQMVVYRAGGTTVAKGGALRVVTHGVVSWAAVDASAGAIKAGDRLAAGANGKVVKASAKAAAGTTLGFALGALADGSGRIAVFIDSD